MTFLISYLKYILPFIKRHGVYILLILGLIYALHYEYKKGQKVCEQKIEIIAQKDVENRIEKTQETHQVNEIKKQTILRKVQLKPIDDKRDTCLFSHNPLHFNCE